MKKKIGIGALILLTGIGGAFVYLQTDGYQTNQAAKGVLDNVIDEDYATAADYVYFFNGETDLEPTISQEKGKDIWIDRIKDLDGKGISLIDYKNLVVKRDDGILRGRVDLILDMDGESVVREDVGVTFTEKNGDWKVQHLEELKIDEVEAWEKALSGYVSTAGSPS
ncbi:hypothetical protein [Planomicrobium sp. Y74]|uniref:hypothetical protein n=1 Tax=Planomicrobium sp. Y74 TaxID=2478977 RepID=UPI000EF510E1|nr:hypothetical protein [Planomicrobium sp. Y74]RLQ92803.1 hypothetical protein D9754_01950 [Planomicrobium sp. Y74]